MFKKKPTVKTFSPVRSQDRRNLLNAVLKDCCCSLESLTTEGKELLVPKDLMSARFYTNSGGGVSDKSHAKLYISNQDGPLWIDLDDGYHILPTLLTVWKNPYILPIVYTFDLVIEENLQNGADLMLRGMVPPFDKRVLRGSNVAIATSNNPTVPVAIGIALIDLGNIPADIKRSDLPHGKGVEIITVIGDEVCNRQWKVPVGPLDLSFPNQQQQVSTEQETVKEAEEGITEQETVKETESGHDDNDLYTTEQIDEAFLNALKQTIYKHNEKINQIKLPIGSSQFMSEYILKNLPIKSANIKKSSYKKATKFLKSMEKLHSGLVKIKGDNKGDVLILELCSKSHLEMKDFQPFILGTRKFTRSASNSGYKIVPSASRAVENTRPAAATGTNEPKRSDDKVKQKQLIQLYQPKNKSIEFFKSIGINKDTYLTSGELREAVLKYIELNKLVSKENPKLIRVDLLMEKSLSIPDGKDGKIFQTRESIINELKASTQEYYILKDDDDDDDVGKPQKGKLPRVIIKLEKRQGRKIITKILNLTKFNVDINNIAQILRIECAASTTIDNGNNHLPIVIIQGSHIDNIANILNLKYGIRKQWIDIQ